MKTVLTKDNSTERINWLDCARAIAIIMVVWNHAVETAFDVSVDAFYSYSNLSKAFFLNGFHVGRLGVPIFLMITGYLMLSKQYELFFSSTDVNKRSYGQFLKRNYLGLFLCIEIWIIIYYIFSGLYFDTPLNFSGLLNNILLIEKTDLMHVWYVYMILGLYIILPFVSYLLHNMDLKLLILPISLTFFTFNFLPILNLIRQIFDLSPIRCMVDTSFYGGTYLLYCIMGYLVYKKVFDKIKSIYWAIIGIVFFILGTALQWFCYSNGFNYLIWYDCFTLIPASLAVFVLLSRIKIKKTLLLRIFTDLSKLSFGIYLVHVFFTYVCKDYLKLNLHPALVTFIYFIVPFVVSYIIVKCLSKIPKLSKVIFYM